MKLSVLEKIGADDKKWRSLPLRLPMHDAFSYIEINGLFVRLHQNPIKLAWFLFFGSKSLKLRSTFQKKRLISTLKDLILYQLGIKKAKEVKKFHFCCHLILKVNGGHRAFDFKQQTVTKILREGSNKSKIIAEIEGVRKASQLDFAPRILRWNAAEKWYEEEYVDGVLGYSLFQSDARIISSLFSREIIPCLEKMILLTSPIRITVGDVVNQCSKLWGYDSLSRIILEPQQIDAFYQFVQLTSSKLFRRADQPIYLIFSHGDFSLQNILVTEKGLKVIDWESISNRSVLYDLHNFFLTELYYGRASKFLVNEINNAIATLQTFLISDNSEISFNLLELAETYRWLYYIERICMLLQRGLSDKILGVISRSIKTFSKYERAILSQK